MVLRVNIRRPLRTQSLPLIMADIGAENSPASLPESPRPRRVHTYSRLTTTVAVLALATSIYALLRIDSTRDRVDTVNDSARQFEADRNLLQAELKNLGDREQRATRELDRRVD